MRASRVLQKCLGRSLDPMHEARSRVLLRSVEALLAGRRLTLMDVARAWPDAERIRAPLKAFDRLLSNPHLHQEREQIYGDMARWLLRGERPVIVIDWSDLKADKAWCLLRAAVPIGGRTLPVLDMVFPSRQQGTPKAEKYFLERLRTLIPVSARPILVTDAGFRRPWFQAVSAMGWDWIGRLRQRTLVRPIRGKTEVGSWAPCQTLYALATSKPRDMGLMDTVRNAPWVCRVVVYRKPHQGRKHRNRFGVVARNKVSLQCAAREREPWLIVASPALVDLSARQLIALYGRRMQIESSFRDLKSHRYGQGFEDSLTRSGKRIEILLLVNALAAFASWLAGLACEATGIAHWLSPRGSARRLYSVLRLGREALVRSWLTEHLSRWLDRLESLPSTTLAHMQVPA
jgi:hypothetical protein